MSVQSYNIFTQNSCVADAGQVVHTLNAKDKYDPYFGYLHDQGLLLNSHQRRRIQTRFISVDSSQRRKTEKTTTKTQILLDDDPLIFNKELIKSKVSLALICSERAVKLRISIKRTVISASITSPKEISTMLFFPRNSKKTSGTKRS